MPMPVVEGAMMMCACGAIPMPLVVTSQFIAHIDELPVATIMDCVPFENIPPFGICALLTAEAMGIPMPCIPAPVGPWVPGSLVQAITELPVLTNDSVCMCGIGGVISFIEPGQFSEESI